MKIKKRTLTIAVLTAIVLIPIIVFGAIVVNKNNKIEELKKNKAKLPASFMYTAHTGCCDTEDNSIASITSGVSYGANIVEFDLNFDEKENPVLCHDEPQGNEVTLEAAFSEIAKHDNLRVNVDAKSVKNLSVVQEEASKAGVLNRIFFTGIREEDTDVVKMSCPAVDYYLNVDVEKPEKHTEEYIISLVEKVKSCGAIGINFNKDNASKILVDTFRRNGLLVSVFTVDDEVEMYEILALAPDNITTRNPDKLQEILKTY